MKYKTYFGTDGYVNNITLGFVPRVGEYIFLEGITYKVVKVTTIPSEMRVNNCEVYLILEQAE